jgi:hypothetical protein
MTILLLSIPLMLIAVAIASVPLLVQTLREHRLHQAEVREGRRQAGP